MIGWGRLRDAPDAVSATDPAHRGLGQPFVREGCACRERSKCLEAASTRARLGRTPSVSASERLTLASTRRSDRRLGTSSTGSAAPALPTGAPERPPRCRFGVDLPRAHAGVDTWPSGSRGDLPKITSARCSSTANADRVLPYHAIAERPPDLLRLSLAWPGSQWRVSIARDGAAQSRSRG
jgi:hypothetical protein